MKFHHQSIELFENITYTLSCSLISGSKPVVFEWSHNGHPAVGEDDVKIDSTDKSSLLTFHNLQPRHSGHYECRARNAFGFDLAITEIVVKGLSSIHC